MFENSNCEEHVKIEDAARMGFQKFLECRLQRQIGVLYLA